MYSKLIIPLDGSALAEQVLPFAVKLANKIQARVLLLHLVEPKLFASNGLANSLTTANTAKSYLTELLQLITAPGSKFHLAADQVETLVVNNEPISKIPEIAVNEGASLIVMATHGKGSMPRMVLGSTASKVLQHSKMPVILLRPNQLSEPLLPLQEPVPVTELAVSDEPGFKQSQTQDVLLVTLDGSVKAEIALAPAIALARLMKARGCLLQVRFLLEEFGYDGIIPDPADMAEENRKRREESYAYLNKIRADLVLKGVECSTIVRLGNPAEEIRACTRDLQPAMLIMAMHAHGHIGDLLLGNTAEDVLTNLNLPIMMINIRSYAQANNGQIEPAAMATL